MSLLIRQGRLYELSPEALDMVGIDLDTPSGSPFRGNCLLHHAISNIRLIGAVIGFLACIPGTADR